MRKTFIMIAAATVLVPGTIAATPGLTAQFDQAQAHDFQQQLKAEFRAMGECLAGQVRTRGWVGHGPKDRINALYNEYAATCYDKIKPTAFDDPDHPDGSRAMYTYTGAEWFACHVDDYSAPNRDDEPMTCTDPSTQAYVERMVQDSKN